MTMFEDFVADPKLSNSKKKHKQLQKLLLKYIEGQKFQEIKNNGNLSATQKYKINELKVKRRILKNIHKDLSERLRPEETFEIWHLHKNLNLDRQRLNKHRYDVTENLVNDITNEDDGITDEESDDDEVSMERQLNKFLNSFDQSSTWTKANFLIKTRGLEVLPHNSLKNGLDGLKGGNASLRNHHRDNLKNLLHVNILRRNWSLAYKTFCLLIRFPNVDIRSIWPLGIEILNRQREETAYDENDVGLFKDEKFFDWLTSFFIINKHSSTFSSSNTRKISAPIWRSGSRTHAPMYVITSLWGLMVKNKYSKLKDRLNELLLEPPYNTDGVFYFLVALCYLVENIKLKNKFSSFDNNSSSQQDDGESETEDDDDDMFLTSKHDIRIKIIENQKQIEHNLSKCEELKFEYPDALLHREVNMILKEIDKDYEVSNESLSSYNEIEFADDLITSRNNISSTPIDMEPIFEDVKEKSRSRQNSLDIYESQMHIDEAENKEYAAQDEGMDFDFDFE